MKNILSNIIITIFFSTILFGCEDQYTICDQPKSVNFRGAFYALLGNNYVQTKVNSLSINPLDVVSYIYKNEPNVSTFYYSLDGAVDSAKYVFQINNSPLKDTITLHYKTSTLNLSAECGSIVVYNLSKASATNHVIDSVAINTPEVANTNQVNLKIFL